MTDVPSAQEQVLGAIAAISGQSPADVAAAFATAELRMADTRPAALVDVKALIGHVKTRCLDSPRLVARREQITA